MRWILLITSLHLLSSHSFAMETKQLPSVSQQPLAIQLAVSALKGCMSQYLSPQAMQNLEPKLLNAIKRVEGYCKNKNEKSAYKAVQYYAAQPEAKAARTCFKQLKPLLDQPNVKNLLQKYQSDINTVLAGGIPQPICR